MDQFERAASAPADEHDWSRGFRGARFALFVSQPVAPAHVHGRCRAHARARDWREHRAALKRMFVLDALGRVAIGVVVGLVAAFALMRLMSSLLFGISPLDAPTYLAALGLLLAAAAFASYMPARRAASI